MQKKAYHSVGFFSETHMVSCMCQASINHLFWWTAVSFLICEFVIKREKVKNPTEYMRSSVDIYKPYWTPPLFPARTQKYNTHSV